MAVVSVAHHPELTIDDIFDLFQRHFGQKYALERSHEYGHFAIKSRNVVVAVRVERDPTRTKFIFRREKTSWWQTMWWAELLGGSGPASAGLMDEVAAFIRGAPEFNHATEREEMERPRGIRKEVWGGAALGLVVGAIVGLIVGDFVTGLLMALVLGLLFCIAANVLGRLSDSLGG